MAKKGPGRAQACEQLKCGSLLEVRSKGERSGWVAVGVVMVGHGFGVVGCGFWAKLRCVGKVCEGLEELVTTARGRRVGLALLVGAAGRTCV